MKKIMTAAALAAGVLALSACGGKKEEAPAAEPTAEEMMAPATETPAADDAAASAEGLDPTGNPIGPGAPAAASGEAVAAPE